MKILNTYTLGRKTYYNVERDDGTRIEVGGVKMEEKTATELVSKMELEPSVEPVAWTTLADASVEEITAEVKKRNLTAKDLDLVTVDEKETK